MNTILKTNTFIFEDKIIFRNFVSDLPSLVGYLFGWELVNLIKEELEGE